MDTLALILSIIGAVNWGLVGICQFDLVAWLFGGQTGLVSRIIYTLVGLSLVRQSLIPPAQPCRCRRLILCNFTQRRRKIHTKTNLGVSHSF